MVETVTPPLMEITNTPAASIITPQQVSQTLSHLHNI